MAIPTKKPKQFGPNQNDNDADDSGAAPGTPVNPQALVQQPPGRSVDPNVTAVVRGFTSKGRSATEVAQDQADADRVQSGAFGARVGGFAPTKPEYKDDPSLPMEQRRSNFSNRTTRAGLQEMGQDQVNERDRVGLSTNLGTPPLAFDPRKLVETGGDAIVTDGGPVDIGPYKQAWPSGQTIPSPNGGVIRHPSNLQYDERGMHSGMGIPSRPHGIPSEPSNVGAPMPATGGNFTSQYGTAGVRFEPQQLVGPPQPHAPTAFRPPATQVPGAAGPIVQWQSQQPQVGPPVPLPAGGLPGAAGPIGAYLQHGADTTPNPAYTDEKFPQESEPFLWQQLIKQLLQPAAPIQAF